MSRQEGEKRSGDILLEFLEAAIHTLLYVRDLYPRTIFVKKKLYATPVYCSVHPHLNSYITESLKGVQELLKKNEVKKVTVVFCNKEQCPVEKIVFDVVSLHSQLVLTDIYYIHAEESLRAALLKLCLICKSLKPLPEGCSFSIQLHTTETASLALTSDPNHQEHYPWIQAEKKSVDITDSNIIPIREIDTDYLQLHLYACETWKFGVETWISMVTCTVTVQEEFQKNPELKVEDISALQLWLHESRPHIPQIPESLLIVFIHSCYYDLEKTKKCIDRYCELRVDSPDFFQGRNVHRPELTTALSVLRFCAFPVHDPNGYHIVFHKLNEFEPSKYVFTHGVTLLAMSLDAALYTHGTLPGFILLFDMQGVRLGHLMRLSLSPLRRFFQYIQEGNPIRLKAVHVINTNSVIDKILFLIKPFVQKELLELLHFHSGENETLLEYLPKSCLPSDYGGELESIDEMHEKHAKLLEDLSPYFQEEEKLWQSS